MLEITLPALHVGQRRVADDDSRFKVMACGRRWGKSRLGAALCVKTALEGGRAWWTAPSYPMSQVGWRLIRQLGRQLPGANIRLVDRKLEVSNGGMVQVRSADNPDSLRGEGLDFVVLDECAFMKEDAWTHAIRPALSDRQGGAMFISTPAGRNWFYLLFNRGMDDAFDEWKSWRYPTSDNPYIADDEIEAARRNLPERIFRQEYLAEFIDDAGGIMRRVREAAVLAPLERPIPGRQYIAGVDIGLKVDYTVISVFDAESKEQVYIDRFNQVPFNVLYDRLEAVYRRFDLQAMTIEDNSIGQPPFEELTERGLSVMPFHTTNVTKQAIIQDLAAAFEHGEIRIIDDAVQINELQAFEGKRLDGGKYKFGAPEGYHDDCVMAMAIAWQGIADSWGMW